MPFRSIPSFGTFTPLFKNMNLVMWLLLLCGATFFIATSCGLMVSNMRSVLLMLNEKIQILHHILH